MYCKIKCIMVSLTPLTIFFNSSSNVFLFICERKSVILHKFRSILRFFFVIRSKGMNDFFFFFFGKVKKPLMWGFWQVRWHTKSWVSVNKTTSMIHPMTIQFHIASSFSRRKKSMPWIFLVLLDNYFKVHTSYINMSWLWVGYWTWIACITAQNLSCKLDMLYASNSVLPSGKMFSALIWSFEVSTGMMKVNHPYHISKIIFLHCSTA